MRNAAQGCICDACGFPMNPFERIKLSTGKLTAGARYPKVSSDTYLKTDKTFDLCPECYQKWQVMMGHFVKYNINCYQK